MADLKNDKNQTNEIAYPDNMVRAFMNAVEEHLYLDENEKAVINPEIKEYNTIVKSKIRKTISPFISSCEDEEQKEQLFLQYAFFIANHFRDLSYSFMILKVSNPARYQDLKNKCGDNEKYLPVEWFLLSKIIPNKYNQKIFLSKNYNLFWEKYNYFSGKLKTSLKTGKAKKKYSPFLNGPAFLTSKIISILVPGLRGVGGVGALPGYRENTNFRFPFHGPKYKLVDFFNTIFKDAAVDELFRFTNNPDDKYKWIADSFTFNGETITAEDLKKSMKNKKYREENYQD